MNGSTPPRPRSPHDALAESGGFFTNSDELDDPTLTDASGRSTYEIPSAFQDMDPMGDLLSRRLFMSPDGQVVVRGRGPTGTVDGLKDTALKFDAILDTYQSVTEIPVVDHRFVITEAYSQEYQQRKPTLCVVAESVGEHVSFEAVTEGQVEDAAIAEEFDKVIGANLKYIQHLIDNGGITEPDICSARQSVIVRLTGKPVMVDVPKYPENFIAIIREGLQMRSKEQFALLIMMVETLRTEMADLHKKWPEIVENGSLEQLPELCRHLEKQGLGDLADHIDEDLLFL